MSTWYIERCPHCKKEIWADHFPKRKSFGDPLRTCSKCKGEFFDASVMEWENLKNEEKKSVLVFGKDKFIMTENWAKEELAKLKWQRYVFPGCAKDARDLEFILNEYAKFSFDERMLLDFSIQKSIERTENPEYRRKLLSLGRTFYGKEYINE